MYIIVDLQIYIYAAYCTDCQGFTLFYSEHLSLTSVLSIENLVLEFIVGRLNAHRQLVHNLTFLIILKVKVLVRYNIKVGESKHLTGMSTLTS